MSIVNSLPNLINGVSQQPPNIRLKTQCEEQINAVSSVVYGLQKRPCSQHLAKILDTSLSGAFVHTINRDKYEKYVVVVGNENIRVFDLDGRERTVHKPNGVDYLKAHDTTTAFSAITVADHTFIVNKTRKTAAYDPTKALNLTPINQRYQVINIKPISPWYRDELFDNRKGYKKWFRCWSMYRVYVNGRLYSLSAQNIGASAFATYLAARLSDELGVLVVNNGLNVEIPLGTSQALYSVQDISAMGVLKWDEEVSWGGTRGNTRKVKRINPRCVLQTIGGVATVSTTTRNIGYKSPNGEVLPAPTPKNKMGIVHIRQGDYGTTYKVLINNSVVASYTTPDKDRTAVQTTAIATQLHTQLMKLQATYTISLSNNVIAITAKNVDHDFVLTCSDSLGDKAMYACKGRVQAFTNLPATCFHGFTIKVAGENGVSADDYYVQYQENTDNESTSGSWVEVAKPGLNRCPAPSTMPHRLVSNADGTFTFESIEWDARKAGDEDTAPEPSFINKTISDVFFFKNRLGLLSDENIIFSELGSYYNFYPTTVVQSLETHPIDVAVTNDTVSLLRHAVPFNETLLLFSDLTQFIIRGQDRLSPETVSVDVTTRFECELKAKPVGAGKNVYFSTRRGNNAGIREYYVDPESEVNDAADITSHCPTYIKGSVRHLSASSNEDVLLTVTDQDPTSLYIYSYYWQGNEKLQSAWGKWQLDGVILAATFIESDIVIVVDRADGVCLERITLTRDNEPVSRGFPTEILLDRRVFVAKGSAKPFTADDLIAVDVSGNVYDEESLNAFFNEGAKADCYVGVPYKFRYQFSQQVARDNNNVAILSGRLQLHQFTVAYVNTGYFQAIVKPDARAERVYTFTGRIIGSLDNRVSEVPIESGIFKFNVLAEAKTVDISLESSSHLPLTFQSAEWKAKLRRTAQRI
ncbi:hypothetical protein [Zooshikella sp. RANM57]|uniref:phage nozzle protein n=1 Tax=Zooshikella sp. RANM57 TaxID=3425863 RepID=UPI003D6F60E9